MNYVKNERSDILCVRVLRQYIRRIGVNNTNKQSHIVSVLSLVFNITIPYNCIVSLVDEASAMIIVIIL